jgi:glycosyltransferase involved in cell wall biosynthesis
VVSVSAWLQCIRRPDVLTVLISRSGHTGIRMPRDRTPTSPPARRDSTVGREGSSGADVRRFVHYVVDLIPPNGVGQSALAWAEVQRRAGYDVALLYDGDEPQETGTGVELVRIRHAGLWKQTRVPVGLGSFLRAGDVVTLHDNFKTRHLFAAAVCGRRQIPYLSMPHGGFAPRILDGLRQPVRPRLAAERRMLERAAAIHLFFDSEKREISRFDPAVSRYVVAPTGVEMPDRVWDGTGNYIAWLGRYAPEHKGLDILLDALAALPEAERPRMQMRGLDYKGGRAVVESMVQKAGLAGWVTIGGPVYGEEKLDFLCRCQAYIHPSRWESHSVALCENLALGVPTVVSNTIHIAPMLKSSGAALVVDLTPDGLSEAIRHLGSAGELRSSLSQKARVFVAENLSWSKVLDSYLSQLGLALAQG